MALRTFYPEIEPYRTGMLGVGRDHQLFWEACGNPKGKPVVFLHGGPGGGTDPKQRRFFDPDRYHVILFDQRGCGKSTPPATLDQTTWDLVADIEALREHLGVRAWMVFGGSWGSTLALAYAEKHPERVTELVLRGIFLLRRSEIEWFYQRGASELFPEAWEEYVAPIPEAERGDMVAAYHRRLTGDDEAERQACARAWSVWEARTSFLLPKPEQIERARGDAFSLAFARIECHYFQNRGFLERDTQLLDDADRIRHVPTVVVQGRYDVVCPATSAWALKARLPELDLRIVEDAGHSAYEPGILHELVSATDRFARR